MKRRLRRLGALVGLASIGVVLLVTVGGAFGVTVPAGNLLIKISGHASPSALPRHHFAPVGFKGSASVATVDGTHVPAAEDTQLLVDKHIRLDTTGLKTCSLNQLRARSPAEALRACGDALIGRGTSSAQVQFAESAPFVAKGPLLAFNGPPSGGGAYGHGAYGGGGYNEQLYYVYASVPEPTALIAVGRVSRATGKYGYKISISIPVIAGGAGSFTSARFKIDRHWTYKGKEHSFLNAECANGHLAAQVKVDFRDGSVLDGTVLNPCQSLAE